MALYIGNEKVTPFTRTSSFWDIILGNISITSKISGTIKYIQHNMYFLPEIDISDNKSWEIFLKVNNTFATTKGTYCSILNDKIRWGSIAIYMYNDNTIGCALGNGSSVWVFDDFGQGILERPSSGDWFYIKYSYDGNTTYTFDILDQDKNIYKTISTEVATSTSKANSMNLRLLDNWDTKGYNEPSSTIFDLSESYIKVNDEIIQGSIS